MAEAIATHDSKVTPPKDFLESISRAIQLRRRETTFVTLRGRKYKKTQLSDSTHIHFTENVLGKVRDLLHTTTEPISTPSSPANATSSHGTKGPSLSEQLASLTIADSDESFDIDEHAFDELPPVDVEFDDTEVEAEMYLAIEVFMEDVYFVRLYIENIWEMYRDGYLDNTVCPLFTNSAIDVIQLAGQDFARLVKRPKRFPEDKFPVWTFPALLFRKNNPDFEEVVTYENVAQFKPMTLPRKDGDDQSDFFLISIFAELNIYLWATIAHGDSDTIKLRPQVFKQSGEDVQAHIPRIVDMFHLFPKLKPEFFKQSGEDGHPHIPRIMEMCHLFEWQARMRSDKGLKDTVERIAEDEIARGALHMIEHKEIPIWVQFATQTYIDIQDLLGERLEEPLQELQKNLNAVTVSVDGFLHTNSTLGNYDPQSLERAQRPINDIKMTNRAFELTLKRTCSRVR
jgi:hypothetical protein